MVAQEVEAVEAAQQRLRDARALLGREAARVEEHLGIVHELVAHEAAQPMRAGGA